MHSSLRSLINIKASTGAITSHHAAEFRCRYATRDAEVSTRIVAELERRAAPWIKPWAGTAEMNMPSTAVTNRLRVRRLERAACPADQASATATVQQSYHRKTPEPELSNSRSIHLSARTTFLEKTAVPLPNCATSSRQGRIKDNDMLDSILLV